MAKKITDENGNTYVQKKPVYKRVWFWILAVVVVFIAAGVFGESKDSNSDTKKVSTSSKEKTEDTYESILAVYTKKLQEQSPKLVAEYNSEFPSNTDGMEGLAKLSTKKIEELAKTSNEGISKMAKIQYKKGSGKYSEYEEWAGKLQDVYTQEASKITDAYTASAQ